MKVRREGGDGGEGERRTIDLCGFVEDGKKHKSAEED